MRLARSDWLGRWVLARHMALSGYITKIIMLETGLTYKQVRRLHQDLTREGYRLERKSRTLRGGATLIRNHTTKLQASLLMQFYFNLGGQAVLRSVDIGALNKAYRIYQAIREDVPGVAGWAPFDITDAWCLAAELRDNEAMIETCHHCKCTYFTSVNQRTLVECPFCREQEIQAQERQAQEEGQEVQKEAPRYIQLSIF
jgi:hypothetical protein